MSEEISVELSELIRDLPLAAPKDAIEVHGVCHDSRQVEPGDLFVALAGESHDGRLYAQQAVERGAVAVLAQGGPPANIPVPWLSSKEDPRPLLGPVSARVYGHPERELTLVGVTGTNGKSTVATLIGAVLNATNRPAGTIGTLGYRFGRRKYAGSRTTPEASDLFRTLRQMRDEGAEAVAMEVSSHALSLGRVTGASYDLAVFTNLSRDHFDFHGDFESYMAAKRRLFDQLKEGGAAVIHLGDSHALALAEDLLQRGCSVVTCQVEGSSGISPLTWEGPGPVRVVVKEAELQATGTRARVVTPDGSYEIQSPLVGRFNLENLATAAAAAHALGLPPEAVQRAFAEQLPLPGRLEAVKLQGKEGSVDVSVKAFVDFAHTDAALAAALRSVKELSQGQVIVVFGCGGDRDVGKRFLMGKIAGELSDLPIVTSDNPRTEDPHSIIAAVEEGLKASGNPQYRVVPDRREAIHRAIAVAAPGSVVLVAGKGDEDVQLIGSQVLPFSDRKEIEQALEDRFGSVADR